MKKMKMMKQTVRSRGGADAYAAAAALRLHTPRFVGQGANGCVYFPSMKCAPGKLRVDEDVVENGSGGGGKYMSKLLLYDRAAETEARIGLRVITALPGAEASRRFAPVISSCPVLRSQIPLTDPAFKMCKVLRHSADSDNDSFLLMKMRSAGKLTMAAQLREAGASFIELEDLWNELVVSIELLNGTAKVVHYDLKSNNVMQNVETTYKPVIIDFGASLVVPELLGGTNAAALWPHACHAYWPNYEPWCPESVLCSALWHGVDDADMEALSDDSRSTSSSRMNTDESESDSESDSDSDSETAGSATLPRTVPPSSPLLLPGDVLGPGDVVALRAAVSACFMHNPTLQALRDHRFDELEAKRRGLYALAASCLGLSRLAAAQHILRSSWRKWDRFALAGMFLKYRPATDKAFDLFIDEYYEQRDEDDENEEAAARAVYAFWDNVDAFALA